MSPVPSLEANGHAAPIRPQESGQSLLPREERRYVPVLLRLPEDTWIEGDLSVPPSRDGIGVRPYDVLERHTERLLRLVNARVRTGTREAQVRSIAVNKDSVMYIYELSDVVARPPVPRRPS